MRVNVFGCKFFNVVEVIEDILNVDVFFGVFEIVFGCE